MKDILYFMHVQWGWIKQRPHFIAEGLSKNYKVKVVTEMQYKKTNTKNPTSISFSYIYRLPFVRFKFIRQINAYLKKIQYIKKIKKSSIIWITSPHQMEYIPSDVLNKKKIIYDCMDDFLEFPSQTMEQIQVLKKYEYDLFKKANIIFASSNYLKQQLIERYGNKNIYVVNNAIKEIENIKESKKLPTNLAAYKDCKKRKVVYIGTISEWFDFDLVKFILKNSDVEFFLFGPTDIKIPDIKGLNHMGSINHDLIFEVMNNADILIMPFIINQLIESVNPVKLYEYIYSGKPCIAPLYGESSHFGDYVYLYKNKNECLKLINKNKLLPLKSQSECVTFCSNNTWKNRLDFIESVISININ